MHKNGYYKKQKTTSAEEDVEKSELLYIAGCNVKWHSHFENSWQFL